MKTVIDIAEVMVCINEYGWNDSLDFMFGDEMREFEIDLEGDIPAQLVDKMELNTESMAAVGFAAAAVLIASTIGVLIGHATRHKLYPHYNNIITDVHWKRVPKNVFDAPFVFDEMRLPEYDKLFMVMQTVKDIFTYLKSLNGTIPSADKMESFLSTLPEFTDELTDDPYALGYDSTEKILKMRELAIDMMVLRTDLSKVYKSTKKKVKPKLISKLSAEEKAYLKTIDRVLFAVAVQYHETIRIFVELLITSKWVGNNVPPAKRLLEEREKAKLDAALAEADEAEYKSLMFKY